VSSPRILFFSPFFYPEPISTGRYNSFLVQALVRRGAGVEVIASHPLYPSWRPVRSRSRLEGVSIHRGGAWVRYPRSLLLRRLVFEFWYAAYATVKAWSLRKRATLAVAIFPPGLFFLCVSRLLPSSMRKVGIVHDLQRTLVTQGEGFLQSLLAATVCRLEGKAFRACDQLIVLSEAMARHMTAQHALENQRVVVSYPFVTVDPAKTGVNLAPLFSQLAQHVVYSGALGRKQNPSGLFEFFCTAARELPAVEFHIFSEGPGFEELRRRPLGELANKIHLHDLVSEADLEELYARSTVQVIPQLESSADACLPSKLPNILAMGSVVLGIAPPASELARIVGLAGAGVVAHSWDMAELLAALRQALAQARSQSPEQRRALASDFLARQFSLESLVESVMGAERLA